MNNIEKSIYHIIYKQLGYYDSSPEFKKMNFEIKESTKKEAGKGSFATEFIPKGTVIGYTTPDFLVNDEGLNYMNDLAYNGSIENYNDINNITQNINVGYIIKQMNPPFVEKYFNWFWPVRYHRWLYAIKNIEKGEELSKYYGTDYWTTYESDKPIR